MSEHTYKGWKSYFTEVCKRNFSLLSDEEIVTLKKASTILRRRALKFMKDNTLNSKDLTVAFGEN